MNKKALIFIFFLINLVGFVSPLLFTVILVLMLLNLSITDQNYRYLVFSVSSVLGFINGVKFPASDLSVYLERFTAASDLNIVNYIFINWGAGIQEPVFSIFSYLCYLLFGGSAYLYVWFLTLISYFFFGLAAREYQTSVKSAFICFMIIVIFPIIFSVSAHLIRQQLALSIATYIFTKRSRMVNLNTPMWLYLFPILIHYSTALFLLSDIIKNIYLKRRIIVGLSACSLLLFIDNLNIRIGDTWTSQDILAGSLRLEYVIGLSVVYLALSFLSVYPEGNGRKSGWLFIAFLLVALMLLTPSNLLRYRLTYFIYVTLLVTFPLKLFPRLLRNYLPKLIVIFGVPLFLLFISNSTWSYNLMNFVGGILIKV